MTVDDAIEKLQEYKRLHGGLDQWLCSNKNCITSGYPTTRSRIACAQRSSAMTG
jgi:hypothetical protein